jgi:DNA helicase-2/ATP-dependent DNA helicase PcrA
MISPDALTDEQRAVVAHGEGPAAVRAVAGAGKTTALLHRIRRLVDDGVPPSALLVTSFNTDTVGDLRDGLSALNLTGVRCTTLHALGRRLIQQADLDGLPTFDADAPDPDQQARILAHRARTSLADERGIDPSDVAVSTGDLVDQIAAWKQQLAYPDLDAAGLPAEARPHASQATHENDDLLVLYEQFEAHRQASGWCTYADMLKTGWECLVQSPGLHERAQSAYEHILVDEFQDVSPAQYRILQRMTVSPHNLMVMGDADQCIYSWRGARPAFLCSFADTYDAAEYRLTDSFRLPLPALALANGLLQENPQSDKRLHLTTRAEGTVRRINAAGRDAEADAIAEAVQKHLDAGVSPADIAVLVRTYGQTPPLERAFMEHDLSHRVDGRPPFYRRPPVQTLLRYLYWAVLERRRRNQGGFESRQTVEHYTDRFAYILKHPTRYIPHRHIDTLTQTVRETGASALDVLPNHTSGLPDDTIERVQAFTETMHALTDRLEASAGDTLSWLVEAIDYETYLRDRSASSTRGHARVQTARALVRWAASHDSVPALLHHVKRRAARANPAPEAAVTVRSIHRAKGREWPVVVVPGCNDGTLPLDQDNEDRPTELARDEERRLFYVACTRTQRDLVLSWTGDHPRSSFLNAADADDRIETAHGVQSALRTPPSDLTDAEVARLCRGLHELGLERYLRNWWHPPPDRHAALQDRLEALAPRIEAAREDQVRYDEAQAAAENERGAAREAARSTINRLQSEVGPAPITVPNEQPETHIPDDARLTFGWVEERETVAVFLGDVQVGQVDPLGSHRLEATQVLNLSWSDLVGAVAEVDRRRIHIRIDWVASAERAARRAAEAVDPPEPPGPLDDALTAHDFQQGYQLLRDVLASA